MCKTHLNIPFISRITSLETQILFGECNIAELRLFFFSRTRPVEAVPILNRNNEKRGVCLVTIETACATGVNNEIERLQVNRLAPHVP